MTDFDKFFQVIVCDQFSIPVGLVSAVCPDVGHPVYLGAPLHLQTLLDLTLEVFLRCLLTLVQD